MIRAALFVLLAAAMAAATLGCGEEAREDAFETAALADTSPVDGLPQDSVVTENLFAEISPGEPIWPEGTTYNDTTRRVTLYARSAGLEAVYKRMRERLDESLHGRMVIEFIIHPDGSVSDVRLTDDWWSDADAASLTDSMLVLVQQWTFPPGAPRPVKVSQPWKFTP